MSASHPCPVQREAERLIRVVCSDGFTTEDIEEAATEFRALVAL